MRELFCRPYADISKIVMFPIKQEHHQIRILVTHNIYTSVWLEDNILSYFYSLLTKIVYDEKHDVN